MLSEIAHLCLCMAEAVCGYDGASVLRIIRTVWSTEIFPSSLRQTAMGLGSMAARVGSIIAPFSVELWEVIERLGDFDAPDGPLLLFGSAGIVAGLVGFCFLPETHGRVRGRFIAIP